MEVVWRPVAGFDGFYEVSNTGFVRSLGRTAGVGGSGIRRVRERVLKDSNRWNIVCLHKDGETHCWKVARLVYVTFVGDIPSGLMVVHKDGNRNNSNVENLVLGDQSLVTRLRWERDKRHESERIKDAYWATSAAGESFSFVS